MNSATTGDVRLTVNVSAELKRRIRLVCTRRQLSMREYLTIVLEERLANDLTPTQEWRQFDGIDSADRSGIGRVVGQYEGCCL